MIESVKKMITYGPVTLRKIEEKDLEFMRDLLNDPEISFSVVDYGFPISTVQQKKWFKTVYPHESAYRFIIEAGGESAGVIVFTHVDSVHETGMMGYKLARNYQGHNYSYYAICALTRWLFDEQDIECVVIFHLHTNPASRKVVGKAGFIFEGVQRRAIYKNGMRQDLVRWSCNRDHYKKNWKDGGCNDYTK